MVDFSEWQAEAAPEEVPVSVCFDRRLYREFTEASERLQAVKVDGMLDQPDDVQDLARKVVDLHERVKADMARHTFVFTTVPYSQWQKAVEAHPPTEQQKAENKYLDFNPDTFPVDAVALSCQEPTLSSADVEWLRENLPRQEFDRLFEAAWRANVGGSSIPKSVSGIVGRLASELKSITPPSEASPSPSSEDGS